MAAGIRKKIGAALHTKNSKPTFAAAFETPPTLTIGIGFQKKVSFRLLFRYGG